MIPTVTNAILLSETLNSAQQFCEMIKSILVIRKNIVGIPILFHGCQIRHVTNEKITMDKYDYLKTLSYITLSKDRR